jgi:hypothetical protein
MAQTVIERWSKDIEEMENEATQRWKNNIEALKVKIESEVSKLNGDTGALKKAFEKYANEFSKDVEAMNKEVQKLFLHIWGTQADKKAWQRRFDR